MNSNKNAQRFDRLPLHFGKSVMRRPLVYVLGAPENADAVLWVYPPAAPQFGAAMRRAQIVSFAAVPLTWLNIVRCASRGILNAVWHEHQLADESIAD